MSEVKCFLIRPTDAVRRSLRRYDAGKDRMCLGFYGYHNAEVPFDEIIVPAPDTLRIYDGADVIAKDDPRWPSACATCRRPFGETDEHQLFSSRLFERVDTKERFTLHEAPPGAMRDADEYHDANPTMTGPDGVSLMVKLPGDPHGWWCVDGPTRDGGRWTREGAIPYVTATPSILTPNYHGFLRNGVLVDA